MDDGRGVGIRGSTAGVRRTTSRFGRFSRGIALDPPVPVIDSVIWEPPEFFFEAAATLAAVCSPPFIFGSGFRPSSTPIVLNTPTDPARLTFAPGCALP